MKKNIMFLLYALIEGGSIILIMSGGALLLGGIAEFFLSRLMKGFYLAVSGLVCFYIGIFLANIKKD